MITISPAEMEKRIDSLPDEVQDMLYSPEMYAAIKQISSKHQLHIDQMDLLETETSQVMLGITETSQFPEILKQSLKIDSAQAQAIAKDIDDVLFSKIRSSMKKNDTEKSVIMPSAMAASAATPTTPVTSAPTPTVPNTPVASTPAPAPLSTDMQIDAPATSAPAKVVASPPQMPEVDVMLSEPTVSLPKKVETVSTPAPVATSTAPVAPATAKVEAPKPPASYKADPYREPID